MEKSQMRKDDGHFRLSQELSDGEKEATRNRKAKVLKCLESLHIACDEDNMPNIAVLGSGGGLRAMIALQGTLVELKKQGLLDAVMYLCGVSGSTWCMSFLYQEKDWTEKVQILEERLCDTLSKPSIGIQEEFTIATHAAEDELFSLTDVWASFFVCETLKQYDKTKLSEHDDASRNGKNPYPIYAAIEANQMDKAGENSPGTWFEFTPHEAGFAGLEAFVDTKYLGSKFEGGKLTEKREEKNICYLQGTDYTSEHCQGVPLLLQELHVHASAGEDCEGIFRHLKEFLKEENCNNSYLKCCEVSETRDLKSCEERMVVFAELIWIFEKELGGHDAQSTGLTNNKLIYLIDAGIAINSAYPLVLRPQRKVQLILSFDFSAGDPFETIKKTAIYCKTNHIPFPEIDPEEIKDPDHPSDCYIFRGKDVPTVMHFPLFNTINCPGKIKDFRDKFTTFTRHYSEDDVKELLKRAKMNVSNNKEKILNEIQQIVSSSTKEF
ncbi:cytosolic phospholipase A2 gamma-like [Eretmochelys imbricata]